MAASERSSRLPRLDYENLDLLSLGILVKANPNGAK